MKNSYSIEAAAASVVYDGGGDTKQRATDTPIVGIRVTRSTDEDHLAGAILRARQAGHDCVLYTTTPPSDAITQFARSLEVPVLLLERASDSDLHDSVVSFARDAGYPGLLTQQNLERRVDFHTSTEALRDGRDYLMTVEYAPLVSNEPRVLVGIPAYNEAQAIGDVVADAQDHADTVLVVDDGSTDATTCRAEEAGATVIQHETNKGYGGALATIFTEAARAHADSLVIIDADGQHSPTEIPNLVETHERTDADIVIGSRFVGDGDTNAPLYRRFGIGVVNLLTNLSLGTVRSQSWIDDTQSGFRLYSADAIASLAEADLGADMSASTDILYHAHHNDLTIDEVGAEVRYDVEDASNVNPITHGIALIMNILRTVERERPILALGVPGFISTFIGFGFGYWALSNYVATGVFPEGLAIVAVFFGLAGLFAGFTATVLHALNQLEPSV